MYLCLKKKTTVSFLIPAYKGQHLAETIESILNQSFTDFELVIVNDCSPDDIDGIVAQYNDSRIRYYKNKENIGGENLVKQWNHCLSFAKGEWTVMASDDDIYHPDYLQEMIRLTLEYPNNDVFHCNILQINDSGEITEVCAQVSEYESWLQNAYYRLTYSRTEALQDYFFRTEKLKSTGGFINFPLATFSDIATILSIADNNGIICSSCYFFKWRNNGKNISSNPLTCKTRISACEHIFDWITQQFEKHKNHDDEVSNWIKERFIQDIRHKTISSEQILIQQMPIDHLKEMLELDPWPYKLLERDYAVRNKFVRIKNMERSSSKPDRIAS